MNEKKQKLDDSFESKGKVLSIIAIISAVLALLLSWIPFINIIAFLLGIGSLILGIIVLSRKSDKRKKILSIVSVSLASASMAIVLISLLTYENLDNSSSSSDGSMIKVTKNSSNGTSDEDNKELKSINKLAKSSKSTGEVYITGDIVVGKDVQPGIYDVHITGGLGNIMGSRASTFSGMYLNWAAGAPSEDEYFSYPSVIRMILYKGDTLEFSDISKVKFDAVSEDVKESNQIGIGNYVVGRDLPAGNYKLSTNMKMDPQYKNLGWDISIYNPKTDETKSQTYTGANNDVVVSLKKGEVITTSFDNATYSDTGVKTDSAKLIFNEMK